MGRLPSQRLLSGAAAYVGEVSYATWGNRYKGQPDPPRLRSLEKFVKVR
jgi:hypothetical protein